MAYGKISDKQREILEYIKKEILNKGYPPTVRDICEAVHLKSTSSVHSHLETLEKNGYILPQLFPCLYPPPVQSGGDFGNAPCRHAQPVVL